MMRVSLSASVAAAALLAAPLALSGPPAHAQQHAAPQSSQENTQAAAQPTGNTIIVVPAADLINRPLRDPQGHPAGTLNQVVLDTENGAVEFVVIGGNGTFNLNGQDIAVPWSALKPPTAARGPITINVSAEKLEKAPRLSPRSLYELNQPRTRAGIYGYYGYPYPPPNRGYGYAGYNAAPAATPGYAGSRTAAVAPNYGAAGAPGYGAAPAGRAMANNRPAGSGGNGSAQSGSSNQQAQGSTNQQAQGSAQGGRQEDQAQRQMVQEGLVVGTNGVVSALRSPTTASAGTMESAGVFARNGNTIGHVDQVMIDVDRGQVAFVLLQRGGFLGLNPSWYAVPIEALAWAPYQGAYRLTVDDQLLNSEPSVPADKNHLPTRVDAQELAQLYQHFGITPYWENNGRQVGSNAPAASKGAGSGTSEPPHGAR